MISTPEREAWLAGHDAGQDFGRDHLAGGGATTALAAASQRYAGREWAAWLDGFGHGISDAVGPIPGHYLSGVWDQTRGTLRTELVSDRRQAGTAAAR